MPRKPPAAKQPKPKAQRRGCGWWLVVSIAVLFGCSLIFGVTTSIGRQMGILPTLAPTATKSPTATATPAPPTATPAPPTATAVPPTAIPVEVRSGPTLPSLALATAAPEPTAAPPTVTPVPPTATTVPPTATAVPATATPVPATATPLPIPTGPVANSNANLREGPGTEYAVVGGAVAGQVLEPVGRNSAGDWLQLASGAWIAVALVDNAPAELPVTAVAATLPGGNPTPAPAGAPTPSWRKSVNGIEFASDCPCDAGDSLNCPMFGIDMDAQACYLRCMEMVGRDVHRLDNDKDGTACEFSW